MSRTASPMRSLRGDRGWVGSSEVRVACTVSAKAPPPLATARGLAPASFPPRRTLRRQAPALPARGAERRETRGACEAPRGCRRNHPRHAVEACRALLRSRARPSRRSTGGVLVSASGRAFRGRSVARWTSARYSFPRADRKNPPDRPASVSQLLAGDRYCPRAEPRCRPGADLAKVRPRAPHQPRRFRRRHRRLAPHLRRAFDPLHLKTPHEAPLCEQGAVNVRAVLAAGITFFSGQRSPPLKAVSHVPTRQASARSGASTRRCSGRRLASRPAWCGPCARG
jgi:hypothetical protein